jgi:hypothetical protein
MNPKNNGFCQAYLSELHQISPADAMKMLKAMNAKEKHKTFNCANLARAEKRKKARADYLANNPDHIKNTQLPPKKSVIAPKAQEPFAKPVPRPQKTDDEPVVTGSKLYSLMIPLEDIERLKQAAKDSGQSVSTLIRAAIKNHLVHYQ